MREWLDGVALLRNETSLLYSADESVRGIARSCACWTFLVSLLLKSLPPPRQNTKFTALANNDIFTLNQP